MSLKKTQPHRRWWGGVGANVLWQALSRRPSAAISSQRRGGGGGGVFVSWAGGRATISSRCPSVRYGRRPRRRPTDRDSQTRRWRSQFARFAAAAAAAADNSPICHRRRRLKSNYRRRPSSHLYCGESESVASRQWFVVGRLVSRFLTPACH